MSYYLNASDPTEGLSKIECYPWFNNALENALTVTKFVENTSAFREAYGLRIVRLNSTVVPAYRWAVEFPSEDEATLFLLRWS